MSPPSAQELLSATLKLAKELSLDLSEEGVGQRFTETLAGLLPGRALCLRVVEGARHELSSVFYTSAGAPVAGGYVAPSPGAPALLSLLRAGAAATAAPRPQLLLEALRGPLMLKRAVLQHTGLPADIATSARVQLTDRYVPLFLGTSQGFSVPLVAGGELLGQLNCEYLEQPGPNGKPDAREQQKEMKRDEAAIIPLCNQVSVALRNLRLLQRSQDLERQVLRAERLATLGQLAAGVVHELNNPLSSIGIYGAFLEKRLRAVGETFAAEADKAQRICEGAARIQKLTRDLMNYGRTSGDKEPLSLTQVVKQGLDLCEPLLRQAQVVLRCSYADELPLLSGVRTQLQQVVVNLITNACHALEETRRSGPSLEIRVGVGLARLGRAAALELTVADTGVGIAEPLQARVFEPFFSTKPEGQGTGLGLPMVKNIVEGHGGQVTFESQAGQGTCFRVLLPTQGPGKYSARAPSPITALSAVAAEGLGPADRVVKRRRAKRD